MASEYFDLSYLFQTSPDWLEDDVTRDWAREVLSFQTPLSTSQRQQLTKEIYNEEMQLLRQLDWVSQLQHSVWTKRVRRSSAWQLPAELLAQVFLHLADANEEFAYPEILWKPPAIKQVCRWWRSIALSTPSLFATLDFEFMSYHHDHDKCSGQPTTSHLRFILGAGLAEWLLASKSCPLDIKIDLDPICKFCSGEIVEPAWKLLQQQLPRWRTFNMAEVDSLSIAKAILHAEGEANQLEELFLDSYYETIPLWNSDLQPLNCPRLRKLTVQIGVEDPGNIGMMYQHLQLSAPELEHLDLRCMLETELDNTVFKIINEQFSSLKRLDISAEESAIAAPSDDMHDRFQLLDLSHCNLESPSNACQYFDPSVVAGCPNLTSLDVTYHGLAKLDKHLLKELRFNCMTSFRISLFTQEGIDDHLHPLMACFPALVELKLVSNHHPSRLNFHRFVDGMRENKLCPLLSSFSIERGNIERYKFIDFIMSRSVENATQHKLLITLIRCKKLPNVQSLNIEAFREALQRYDMKFEERLSRTESL